MTALNFLGEKIMKALSIVALVLAGISFIIPVVGLWTAIVASIMAVISFRSQATLSGIAIGLNIINTAFFSPSLLLAEGVAAADQISSGVEPTGVGAIYWTYVGIHIVALIIGGVLLMTKKS